MTTWSGWEADFLSAASLPNTANNRSFLDSWAANANHPSCGNNPIDLTRHEPGSTNCASTGRSGVNVQKYTSHTWARTAFNSQIHSGNYAALLAAMQSGNPYGVSDPGKVSTDLGTWSSTSFANVYLTAAQAPPTSSVKAPKLHNGWSAMQRSFNKRLPAALDRAAKNRRAALRELGHGHKVKR